MKAVQLIMLVFVMDKGSSTYSPESRYALNFSFSQKRLGSKNGADFSKGQFSHDYSSKACMSSNVISETSLEDDFILLAKKSLLKRKSRGSLKIFYSEIIDLKLIGSDISTLYSSIEIIYSKNGYSKHLISLSSSDGFAVRWFYDELVVRHSLFKSNLNDKRFDSDEKSFVGKGDDGSDEKSFVGKGDDDSDGKLSKGTLDEKVTLDDFMNQMNAEISDKRKREISKQMKFDRCSSGEY